MKKIFTSVLFAAMSAGLLAGCATTTVVTPKAFASADEVIGFQTVSTISLLNDIKFAEGDLPSSETSSSEITSSEITTEISSEVSSEVVSSESSSEASSEVSSEASSEISSETPTETLDVTKYLGVMEQILSNHPIQMATETSDRAEYAFKMTITTTDLNGVSSVFVLYFNELAPEVIDPTSSEVSSEIPVDSSTAESSADSSSVDSSVVSSSADSSTESSTIGAGATKTSKHGGHGDGHGGSGDGHWDDNHGDENSEDSETSEDVETTEEVESSETNGQNGNGDQEYENNHGFHAGDDDPEGDKVTLNGIVLVNGVEYELVGKRNATETSFFVSIDEANWIRVSSEIDSNEESYKYTISVDGVRTKASFKIETEDNGDLKVTVKQIISGLEYSYKFFKTVDSAGNDVIDIKAVEAGVVTHIIVTITVDPVTGDTTYTYFTPETGHTHEDHGHHGYADGGRDGGCKD